MKNKTFNYILGLIRQHIIENSVVPTNSVSSGQISGLGAVEGDMPPIDLRKRRYRRLPSQYKKLLGRRAHVY